MHSLVTPALALGNYVTPGIAWAAALVLATACAIRSAQRAGLDSRVMYWGGVCAVLGGIWGSHLLGIVVYGRDGDSLQWLRFWNGGKSYYGGLIGGGLCALGYFRIRGVSLLDYGDAMTPAVGLGYFIGRIGCFLNGDDYGIRTASRFAVEYPPGTEAHHVQVMNGWIAANWGNSLLGRLNE